MAHWSWYHCFFKGFYRGGFKGTLYPKVFEARIYKYVISNFSSTPVMSKSKGKVGKLGSTSSRAVSRDQEDSLPVVYDERKNSILIHVLAKPGAKHNNVTGIDGDGIGVQIAAPPVDGEANTELIKFFSKILEVKKSCISLDKGNRSRSKVLSIQDNCGLSSEDILLKIQSQISTSLFTVKY